MCQDYVTEKFFLRLTQDLVPVVLGKYCTVLGTIVNDHYRLFPFMSEGSADYDVRFPERSFINARNFATPKDLAKYLLYLDRHPQEYLTYLWWKPHFQVVQSHYFVRRETIFAIFLSNSIIYTLQTPFGLCNLCHKLHTDQTPKVYHQLDDWYFFTTTNNNSNQPICQPEGSFPWSSSNFKPLP